MGIVALLVFIAVTVVMNTALKRDISESLVVALLATALLGGADAPQLLVNALATAAQSEVTFAGMAFVFMGIVVQATGLIDRLIEILNSVFGRLRGGAAYVSTLSSAMIGLIAGSTAGNSATVGSVTIPWMKKTGCLLSVLQLLLLVTLDLVWRCRLTPRCLLFWLCPLRLVRQHRRCMLRSHAVAHMRCCIE